MINRAAVILVYKEPFIRWINESDPHKGEPGIDFEELKNDRTVYLVSVEDGENIELEDWYADESLWPKKRDRKTFNEWVDVEYHMVIIDTVKGPIEDDEE